MSATAQPPVIVALGASAGGLKAFELFFKAAPADMGAAYVVIPHLDPHRHSLMADLIGNYTQMRVEPACDGAKVLANHVYVIPPNSFMSVEDGVLKLETPIENRGSRRAIDIFFRSLALTEKQRAVGIVLSGTGTDGTLGIKAIKEHGGMVMAQEPKSAEHDGMPRSAIGAGIVDFVLAPEQMPEALKKYVGHQYVRGARQILPESGPEASDDLEKALAVIHARTGRDFRHYKRGTIHRRTQRRMGLHQIHDLPQYLELLRSSPDEAKLLLDDLLIGVTQFYRDKQAFEQLEQLVLPELMKHAEDMPLRIWVPGCSTGEEAYSIAISCMEAAAQADRHADLQIFATDIDERALAIARTATYPESIAEDIRPDRLHRYFSKEDHRYRVNKNVREAVVFAPQNLIQDAPFSKLDLISCRNLLIYLESPIQKKLFSLFNFALNPNGYLFLGNSESVGASEHLFRPLDKHARIYAKSRRDSRIERPSFPIVTGEPGGSSRYLVEQTRKEHAARPTELIRSLLLDEIAPPAVAVTPDYRIIYASGRTADFLHFPSGEPTSDLLMVARRGLRIKLRKVIRKAFASGEPAVEYVQLPGKGRDAVEMRARPISNSKLKTPICLLTFIVNAKSIAPSQLPASSLSSTDSQDADEAFVAQLEAELRSTREDLQGTIEELESSNEELKTSNEEAMSMNEELQSTNEELETSKEELQSLNEEVSTVNTELQEKLDLLEKTNNDLRNLLSSTDIATLFLTSQGEIRRFTPSAQRIFKLIPSDIGRPIQDISNLIRGRLDIAEEVRRSSEELIAIEGEVESEDGRWYARRVAPYRTTDRRIDGAVVTFADITRIKVAERSLRESETRYRLLYDDNPSIYFTLDEAFVIRSVNAHGALQLGMTEAQLIGQPFTGLYAQSEPVRGALNAALSGEGTVERWEARMKLKDIGEPWTRGVTRQVIQDGEPALLVSLYDISEEKRLSESVYYYSTHDYLTGLLNRREFDRILHRVCSSSGNQPGTHALLYIDLANFKLINDTAGHAAGDEALKLISDVLQRGQFRGRDVVARLGGDEFALILEFCMPEESLRVATEIIEELRNAVFKFESHHFVLECYIGIVPIRGQESTAEEVLRSADAACYEAKEKGPGSVQAVDLDQAQISTRRTDMEWAKVIRSALTERSIGLTCEPIVRGAKDKVVGFEFLLRMKQDNFPASTSTVIRAMERYSLAPEVDMYIIDLALSEISQQLSRIDLVEFVSINISGQSLGRVDFMENVEAAVRSSRIPPTKLCFEVTETAAVSNIEGAARFMQRLRGLGCKIALDDFGSGLSSFHYLKNLPCDLLKIDGAFVRDIVVNESDRSLVSAIHGIAQLLGIATVAEFVENQDINAIVRDIGVDYRQGHHFGPKGSLEEVLKAIRPVAM